MGSTPGGRASRIARVAAVPEIFGSCDERFAGVRAALENNFREHGELGAAVAVTIDGRQVVDIWAGWMDSERKRMWGRDTLVDVFSVGKGMAALCVLILVERGLVALESPVSRYWPEFAARGKGEVTVGMLLSHRAGLPAIRRLVPEHAMYDWGFMAAALADEVPWWEPGSTHGYHVNTFGFLTGEIVRRVSGKSIGEFFAREVAGPLDADFHFGIGPQEDRRVADYLFPERPSELGDDTETQPPHDAEAQPPPTPDPPVPLEEEDRRFLLGRVYMNPPGLSGLGTVNTRAWRAAEIPSANAHATARAVARLYTSLALGGSVNGIQLLDPDTIEQAISEASSGIDFVLGRPSRFGLGFQLTHPERPLGPNPRSFGHFGAGGSLGFADPDAGLAFGYALNRSGPRWQNPRNRALIEAVYSTL
jgi:CubicO group peptidase (beta-lactamase class C family)